MNLEQSIKEYLTALSSNSPTPGGGNVSAFCGALASALGTMVCNLTIGKKKYAAVEAELIDLQRELTQMQNSFIELAMRDNSAFEEVMEAFKLPKETEEERVFRAKKIDDATINAAIVPSQVIELCHKILPHLQTIAVKGNQNSVSDAAVALLLIKTAGEGAFLNVLINCASIQNKIFATEFVKKSELLVEEIRSNADDVLQKIKNQLIGQVLNEN